MIPIIQGNDAVVSVILHQRRITLADTPAEATIESHKIDLSQVRDLSVRLIPYMRWAEVAPEIETRGNVLEVTFSATQQRPSKWDIEITFMSPSGEEGRYQHHRICQGFAEVFSATPRGFASPQAYIVSAEVAATMQGERGERGEKGDPGRDGAPGEKGERGEKGEQGLPGTPGHPGQDGANGERGADGKSAYQSYLETTTDSPALTEREWANTNDYIYQFIQLLIYGTSTPQR